MPFLLPLLDAFSIAASCCRFLLPLLVAVLHSRLASYNIVGLKANRGDSEIEEFRI